MTTKVGKNLRNIYDSVADMVDNCKAKVGEKVETLGYYAPNDGGGAEYVVVEGGTGTDDGGKFHNIASGLQVELTLQVSAKLYGCVGDGVTDDSSKLQVLINNNKGKLIVIDEGYSFVHAGLLLDGSSYNNTKIKCLGTLKLGGDGSSDTFGGAWVGLIIKDCNDVELWYRGDGDRANKIQREQIHMIGLAGANRCKIHTADIKEIRGDGIYVSQSDWLSESAQTQDLYIGTLYGRNSANDGRNLLSIIACSTFEIDFFSSVNVGGVVNGVREPGGLDIEPNFFYQKVLDGVIGTYQSQSDANFGLSILGREQGGDYNVKNITIGTVSIKNTYSGSFGVLLEKCERVTIGEGRAEYIEAVGGVGGVGIGGSFHRDCRVKMSLYGHRSGTKLGISGEVSDCEYDLDVRNWRDEGFQLCWITRCIIKGSVYGSSTTSSNFGVHVRDPNNLGGVVMSNTKLSIDVINDGQTARGYRHHPDEQITFDNVEIVDCNVSGYNTFIEAIDNFGQNVRRRNIVGVTEATAQPQNGTWSKGDFVSNIGTIYFPSVNTIITGWLRITDGSGNIANTDWVQVSPKDN